MKHSERFEIATKRYEEKLRKNGSSEFAISIAMIAGMDFLSFYRTAHRDLEKRRK